MKKLLYLLLILTIFILSDCKKENPATPAVALLQKVVGQIHDSIDYKFYTYNNQNELIAFSDSNNNGDKFRQFINYNISGLPVSASTSSNNTYNGEWSTPDIDTFFYNINNQIIQSVFYENTGAIRQVITTVYTYDASGNLVADSTSPGQGSNHYSYDSNNDCIMITCNSQYGSDTITASYTLTTNPYIQNGLGIAGYIASPAGMYDFNVYLSKHNTSQITYKDGSTATYTYQYDSNGLPVKATVIYNDESSFPQTFQFFY